MTAAVIRTKWIIQMARRTFSLSGNEKVPSLTIRKRCHVTETEGTAPLVKGNEYRQDFREWSESDHVWISAYLKWLGSNSELGAKLWNSLLGEDPNPFIAGSSLFSRETPLTLHKSKSEKSGKTKNQQSLQIITAQCVQTWDLHYDHPPPGSNITIWINTRALM